MEPGVMTPDHVSKSKDAGPDGQEFREWSMHPAPLRNGFDVNRYSGPFPISPVVPAAPLGVPRR